MIRVPLGRFVYTVVPPSPSLPLLCHYWLTTPNTMGANSNEEVFSGVCFAPHFRSVARCSSSPTEIYHPKTPLFPSTTALKLEEWPRGKFERGACGNTDGPIPSVQCTYTWEHCWVSSVEWLGCFEVGKISEFQITLNLFWGVRTLSHHSACLKLMCSVRNCSLLNWTCANFWGDSDLA